MRQRVEQIILLVIAIVSGAAPFGVDPQIAGAVLAALNIALALCVGLQ